jgi:thermostable 8-oxoguanine DNA glycosylase
MSIKTDQNFESLVNFPDFNWAKKVDCLWELLTCVLLDTRTPLERLTKVVNGLKAQGMLDYRNLHALAQDQGREAVAEVLHELGYPWWNQKSRFFEQDINLDLETATWEQMQTINGIGPKLASLWMRMVHNDEEHPIIDTHVKRWLMKEYGVNDFDDYETLEAYFKLAAKEHNLSIAELDRKIVGEGIARRRGLL